MTDAELKVGLAFHGISGIAAFAVLLYMRCKAEASCGILIPAADVAHPCTISAENVASRNASCAYNMSVASVLI